MTAPTITTFPTELLEKLLGALPLDKSLLNATEVHPKFLTTIRSPPFWKQHYRVSTIPTYSDIHAHIENRPDEWMVHFANCKYSLFGRNLLKNSSGVEGLTHWQILSGDDRVNPDQGEGQEGGDGESIRVGWSILSQEKIPIPFPNLTQNFCFSTDEYSCSKQQSVDLWEVGFTPGVMRAVVPFEIVWGVEVSTPNDNSGGYYDLQIRFLNSVGEDILLESARLESMMNQSHTLPPGIGFTYIGGSYEVRTGKEEYELIKSNLRYVHFYHGGMSKGNESGEDNGVRIFEPRVIINLLKR